jgi:D-sedoheptulose 7-phosphate isomerase
MTAYVEHELAAHDELLQRVIQTLQPSIVQAGEVLAKALAARGRVILFGNGGSAADALHLAAELVGRFATDEHPLPALALTSNPAALTALANDFGYDDVFVRQVRALAQPSDVAVGASTTGRSRNVNLALDAARDLGCATIGLGGGDAGDMPAVCDVLIRVPSRDTARVQEMHLLIGHVLCGIAKRHAEHR